MKKFKIIVFLGVDGSGKSTLIKSIFNKNKIKYKMIHFTPDYFRKKKNPVINPHENTKRSKVISLLKIIYWIFNFQIFKILNYNSKKIFLFDRYLFDLIIDPKRYRFSLSDKTIKFIIKPLLKPDLVVLLTGNPKKIYLRKKEIKLRDTIILNNKYIKFTKAFDKNIILDALDRVNLNRSKILNYFKKQSF